MHLCRALYGDAILVHRFGASLVVFSISIPESGTKLSESTGSSPGLFPKGKASCMATRLSQRRVVYWVTDVPGPNSSLNSSRPQPRTQASSRYLNDQRLTRG